MLGYASRAPVGSVLPLTFEAYDTRAGGLPAYFEKTQERPLCRCCGQPLYLVAQVYAPTDRDRSLLIFGCNSVPCNGFGADSPSLRTPGALWSVQRTQSAQAYAAAPEYVPAVEAPLTAAVVPTPETDSWGAVGAWGDAPFEGAVVLQPPSSSQWLPVAMLPRLLFTLQRQQPTDAASPPTQSRQRLKKAPIIEGEDSAEDSDSEGSHVIDLEGVLPADAEAQQWRSYKQWLAATGEEAKRRQATRSLTKAPKQNATRGRRTPRKKRRITRAMEVGWVSLPALGGRKSAAQQHPKVGRHKGDARKAPPTQLPTGQTHMKLSLWARGTCCDGKRGCRRAERPCIRYAYGEQPRWPVPPADVLGGPGGEVPPCPCGRPRVFELQLLPAILTLLDVDEHTGSRSGRSHFV